MLGQCLTARGRYDQAEPLLLEGCRMIRKTLATRRPQAARARLRLVELYEAWGKAAPAEQRRVGATDTPGKSATPDRWPGDR